MVSVVCFRVRAVVMRDRCSSEKPSRHAEKENLSDGPVFLFQPLSAECLVLMECLCALTVLGWKRLETITLDKWFLTITSQ